jgi:hypothetical protein
MSINQFIIKVKSSRNIKAMINLSNKYSVLHRLFPVMSIHELTTNGYFGSTVYVCMPGCMTWSQRTGISSKQSTHCRQ